MGGRRSFRVNSLRVIPNLNSPQPASLSAWAARIGSSAAYSSAARLSAWSYIPSASQPVCRSEFLGATIAQNAFLPNQHSARSGEASRVKESFGLEGPRSEEH